MKKIFFFTTVLNLLLSGCMKDNLMKEGFIIGTNGIIVRASKMGTVTTNDVIEPIIFTGNDIIEFKASTREIRFNNNVSMKAAFTNIEALKFYIDDEYLFSAIVYVDSSISQVFNSLVFYYNTTENKYFLLDGYPPAMSDIASEPNAQGTRDENMQNIASEWEKFINALKKNNKYTN